MKVLFCEKLKDVIEFFMKLQWWVCMKEFVELVMEVVWDGRIKIKFEIVERNYFCWFEDINDWCISC